MGHDFIVIGGGVIGMTTARELASRGAKVALFEQGQLGMEASHAAGGILSSMRPWAENPASAELSELSQAVWPGFARELENDTGIDPEYLQSGLLLIESDHIEKVTHWARLGNIRLKAVPEGIPAFIKLSPKTVFLPDIAQIRPPRLIVALKESLRDARVGIYANTEIREIVMKNRRFVRVEHGRGKTVGNAVIVAAGAWSLRLLGDIRANITIRPIHGQMLCLRLPESRFDRMILDDAHYLIPRQDGYILIGSTMEDKGFRKVSTRAARRRLLAWAYSVWPALAEAEFIAHWSGLRPANETGRPFIGPLPGYEGIYMNAGHFRKGILQCPVSASLLADYLFGRPTVTDISHFSIKTAEKMQKTVRNGN